MKAHAIKYSPIKNKYEVMLEEDSRVTPCYQNIPNKQCNVMYMEISEVKNLEVGTFVNIIGIVLTSGNVEQYETHSGRHTRKRRLTLMDSSEESIPLVLWGEDVDKVSGVNSVVACKAGKIIRTASAGLEVHIWFSSKLILNP